jgi:S1-C subfamily serine protease
MENLFKANATKLLSILILFVLMNASCLAKINHSVFKFNHQHKQKIENFVFLLSVIDSGEQSIPDSTASGFVFKKDKENIYIMTANHFCNPSHYFTDNNDNRTFAAFNKNEVRKIEVEYYDKKNDVCVLKGKTKEQDKFPNIKIAKSMPDIGDKIYNVAAPKGISAPNVVLLFDGYFGGCNDTYSGCLFTIPATFGSSGSAVYNDKEEVISIIVASYETFSNISIGPHVNMVKGIKEYENLHR